MLKATQGKVLPTTITGSLPRPSWYTENLGTKAFLDAMVISRFREQYVDALSVYVRAPRLGDAGSRRRQPHVVPGEVAAELTPRRVDGGDRVEKLYGLHLPGVLVDLE